MSSTLPGAIQVGFVAVLGYTSVVVKRDSLLVQVLRGTADASVPFDRLRRMLGRYGFDERIRGGHHIFTRTGVEEILNLQPKGRDAKAYQVKQVRAVIVKHRLAGGADDQ